MKFIGLLFVLTSMLTVAACKDKRPAPAPPAATVAPPATPPPPAPVITLRAQPGTIERGGSTTLQWEARNASTVSITPGVGDVAATGNRSVNPTSSVTYTATAMGPGGSASDTARVTVNIPAAPPPTDTSVTNRPPVNTGDIPGLKDILFDYDQSEVRQDQVSTLTAVAAYLKQNPNRAIQIEGHCDERGSEEYNLGLGDRRANAVKEFLQGQGISTNRMSTVSYGEERPQCRAETEECFAMNRRAHFVER
jgi:peptidoglycan-associated lipoprotein